MKVWLNRIDAPQQRLVLLMTIGLALVGWLMFSSAGSGRQPTLELVHYCDRGWTNGYMARVTLRLKNDTGEIITVIGNPRRVSFFSGSVGKENQFSTHFPKNVVLQNGEEYVFEGTVWNSCMPWVAAVEYVEGNHTGGKKGLTRVLPRFLEDWIWKREISQMATTVATIPPANDENTVHEMAAN
jgi:hypothetical protein